MRDDERCLAMKVWSILTALVLLGACRVEAVLTTNSWTNSVSSKWETPGN